MNIFVLDEDPAQAAWDMCNKHVVKMIVESCQLLSTAHHVLDGIQITRTGKNGRKFSTYETTRKDFFFPPLLRCTMVNHPCTIWTRSSNLAYSWLWSHVKEMLKVYEVRYNKVHAYDSLVQHSLIHKPKTIPITADLPPFAQAMPDQYKKENAVEAYRAYYVNEKSRFAKWPDGKIPKWYLDGLQIPVTIPA
jgi:hypothetical protein